MIISGGMGGGAVDIFNERGVEIIVGVQGDARTAVETYLKGELISTGSLCHNHEHVHECGEHPLCTLSFYPPPIDIYGQILQTIICSF